MPPAKSPMPKIVRYREFGFRGEALASVASVSRFKISSAQPKLTRAGISKPMVEQLLAVVPLPIIKAHRQRYGICFNTPARRKFLKAERTENQQIDLVMRRLSLAHMDVGFSLVQFKRPKCSHSTGTESKRLNLIAGDLKVGSQVLSPGFVEQSIFVDESAQGYRLYGWVGLPQHNRRYMDQQFFYVNGRSIRDKLVGHAIPSYSDVMFHGRHAVYVFWSWPPIWWTLTCIQPNTKCDFAMRARFTGFYLLITESALRAIRPARQEPTLTYTEAISRPPNQAALLTQPQSLRDELLVVSSKQYTSSIVLLTRPSVACSRGGG